MARAADEVQAAVDAINDLPEDAMIRWAAAARPGHGCGDHRPRGR